MAPGTRRGGRRPAYNQQPADEESFGAMVRELREAKGWSQQQLADAVCELGGLMTQGDVSNIELGKKAKRPSLERVEMLANALGVSVGYLFSYSRFPEILHAPPDILRATTAMSPENKERLRLFIRHSAGEDDADARVQAYLAYLDTLAKTPPCPDQ